MTAEVAIMNRIGVALAADSAVTLGGSENKIYTSADKLFLLSEGSPIGVMVYGNANVLGVPWETVIKVYRKQLDYQTFPTLVEHAQDFINYLKNERTLFSDTSQESHVATITQYLCAYFHEKIFEKLEKELEARQLSESDIMVIFEKLIDDEIKNISNHDLFEDLPEEFIAQLKEKYTEVILSAKNDVLGKMPSDENIDGKIVTVVAEFLRRSALSTFHTGVIIAGFGDDEHFPSLFLYEIDGIACNHLLYKLGNSEIIGNSSDAVIMPFAQQEMVYAFMEGIDPELKDLFEQSVSTLFHGVSQSLIEGVTNGEIELDSKFEKRVMDQLNNLLEELFNQWNKARSTGYTMPILDIVASLPKDELADMAESLVNLTKFKRRVSRQQETVGGPIDVAVITKGDGFVWIKKKHYFKGTLNPRFLSKYDKMEKS